MDRRDYAKWAGWAALALAVISGMVYTVRATADWGLWVPLGLAVALAIFWLSEFRGEAVQVVTSRRARQGGAASSTRLRRWPSWSCCRPWWSTTTTAST